MIAETERSPLAALLVRLTAGNTTTFSEYHGRLVAGLADVIVERLRAVGTRALFGVPGGGGNLDLIDAARRGGLPFVLTTTETAGVIAAIAQSEVTGCPGACLTTLGPGAASAVNGVACAHLERARIFIFTDSYASTNLGKFEHQTLDHHALLRGTGAQSLSLAPDRAYASLAQAFASIEDPPYGPIHLDCPADFHLATRPGESPIGRSRPAELHPDERARLTSLCERARKPLLIIGLGARGAADADAIRAFCGRRQIPAMVTYKAKGVVPDAHACFAGVFTNGAIEREIIDQADLLIGIGLDPVELLPRPWTIAAPVVGFSALPASSQHVPFAIQWTTDIPSALATCETWIGESTWKLSEIARLVADQRRRIEISAGGLTPDRVVDVAAAALSATSRVTVDAGAHMFPATMKWPVARPNGMLISNGLSTMGFALPAAIGAALVDRPTPVVALTGDGGLLMCMGELLTAVRENLRVITIVFSDEALSLIEIKQQARTLAPAGVALGAVKWPALAESMGVAGFEASTEAELARAIERAVACEGPSLIEAKIDRSTYGTMLKAIRG